MVDDGVNGREPWFTDGNYDGTCQIKDINPDGNSLPKLQEPAYVDGRIVFNAFIQDEGHELWISDGTPNGTYLLADIEEGPVSSFPVDFIA